MNDSGFQSQIGTPFLFQKTKSTLSYLLNQTSTLLEQITVVDYPPSTKIIKNNIIDVLNHIDKLNQRIQDKHSRVLITGDLNAGKSTLVNTLLRRQVVPDDQEPCTAMFVEVIDAAENDGIEQVHCIYDPENYNCKDSSTFRSIEIDKLREEVENEDAQFELLKVYCKDGQDSSLLHNGLVDISLIDSPGLNIDSMKTTSLFSKQQEIDVIVFVVNAENHFTLSGKQFLETATREKAYVFIVVNRFDSIKRRERNKRDILEQIKTISPSTFGIISSYLDDADNLVHFISAKQVFQKYVHDVEPNENHWLSDFEHLEDCLRSFVLDRRMLSKLAPAKVYLQNILEDIDWILTYNIENQSKLIQSISENILQLKPHFDQLVSFKKKRLEHVEEILDQIEEEVGEKTRQVLIGFLSEFELFMESVTWKGVFQLWDYAHQLRVVVCHLASIRLGSCYRFAQECCIKTFSDIESEGNQYLEQHIGIDIKLIREGLEQQPKDDLESLANLSLFESLDKFDMVKDYLPSFAILGGSLLGYRSLTTGIVKNSFSSFGRVGKLLFVGLFITGCGMVLIKVSDIKQEIQSKIIAKMNHYFEDSKFVSNHVSYLRLTSRRVLLNSLKDFDKRYQMILNEKENIYLSQSKDQQDALDKSKSLGNLKTRSLGLLKELGQVMCQ